MISSFSQTRSKSDKDDPFKLLVAQLEVFQGRQKSSIDFTVHDYVDTDNDFVTSVAHLLKVIKSLLKLLKQSLMQQNMIIRRMKIM